MVNYTVVNGNSLQLTNINAGGTDVEPYSYKDGITLTSAELLAILDDTSAASISGEKNVAVFADQTGDAAKTQKKRSAALAALYLSA